MPSTAQTLTPTEQGLEGEVGNCETCQDPKCITWPHLPVRRDDRPESRTVQLCFDCASIIRHGSHEEWNGLVVLGDLRGRTISWRRPIDDSLHSGIVLRESLEPNRLDVWSPGDGVFKRFRMTVHRSTIVNVWPIPAIPNPAALAR